MKLNKEQLEKADRLIVETAAKQLSDAAIGYLKLVYRCDGKPMLVVLGYGMYLVADPGVAAMVAQLQQRNGSEQQPPPQVDHG